MITQKRILNNIIFTFFAIVTSISLYSCGDDSNPSAPNPPTTVNLIKLDSAYAMGARASVSLYVLDSLHTGYNPVYFVLYDSVTHALITDAHVEIELANHGHAAPVENPPSTAVDGKFPGAMILTAPQTGDDPMHWHYHIHVHNHQASGEPEGEAEFSDFVVKDTPDKFKSIILPDPDSTGLFVSFVTPRTPAIGMNDFEFTIHKNEPELFPYDGTCTIQSITEYVTTGQTTTGNVTPVHSENGHYKGKVNLTQSGLWKVKLNITKNGYSYDTYFEFSY